MELMKQYPTPLGTVFVGSEMAIFERLLAAIEKAVKGRDQASVALTGGSTPKAFYKYVAASGAFSEAVRQNVLWTVSDERRVPLEDDESNFGVAERMLLDPLGIPAGQRLPWPVAEAPEAAAAAYTLAFSKRSHPFSAYDLCFLGMGDDGHTASIFPGSPLLELDSPDRFAAVEVPEKGWRLSITPNGLGLCGSIVISVTGAGKAARLASVFAGNDEVVPVQILGRYANKVHWLVDEAAAEGVDFKEQ
jgi:6-phosphogluconolactonase